VHPTVGSTYSDLIWKTVDKQSYQNRLPTGSSPQLTCWIMTEDVA
jgi:hypothetical protein